MTWPDHFPDGCPPAEAVPASGEFYRLVDHDPVEEVDFWSHRELSDAGLIGTQRWTEEMECRAVACSVFQDKDDAVSAQGMSGRMRKKRIAMGDVSGDGVLLATPSSRTGSSHHSWWRNVGDVAWRTFSVLT